MCLFAWLSVSRLFDRVSVCTLVSVRDRVEIYTGIQAMHSEYVLLEYTGIRTLLCMAGTVQYSTVLEHYFPWRPEW